MYALIYFLLRVVLSLPYLPGTADGELRRILDGAEESPSELKMPALDGLAVLTVSAVIVNAR
jgi:hypothetical protein